MRTFLLLCSIALGLGSCNTTDDCVAKEKQNCVCNYDYNPVCGCDNVTYGNACAAECNGISDYKSGACPED